MVSFQFVNEDIHHLDVLRGRHQNVIAGWVQCQGQRLFILQIECLYCLKRAMVATAFKAPKSDSAVNGAGRNDWFFDTGGQPGDLLAVKARD